MVLSTHWINKKHLLIFIGLFICFASNAQLNFNFKAYDMVKIDERSVPIDLIDSDENGYAFLYGDGKFGRKDKTIKFFDKDLNFTGKSIPIEDKNSEIDFVTTDLFRAGDSIIHIFEVNSDYAKNFYYEKLSISSLERTNKKLISSLFGDNNELRSSFNTFIKYPNNLGFALIHSVPVKNAEKVKMKIVNYDSLFNELNFNIIEFDYLDKQLNIDAVFTTTKMEVIIVAKYFENYNKTGPRAKEYEYKVFKLKDRSLKEVSSFGKHDTILNQLKYRINADTLEVTGLYSERNNFAIKGVFYASINLLNGQKLYESFNNFNKDFFYQLMSNSEVSYYGSKIESEKYEAPNYVLHSVHQLENGQKTLVAQQLSTVTTYGAITYYFKNIAVICIDKKGEILWSRQIGRNAQKGNVPFYSSIIATSRDNKMLLFYNDNVKNLDHVSGRVENAFQIGNRAFICTKFDDSGNFKRIKLADQDVFESIYIRPNLYNWVDNDNLLLFGQELSNVKNQRFFNLNIK